MLVALGDTHGTDDHRLEGAVRDAVREADTVVHTGDFTTAAVLDAFEDEAASLTAVYGNNDDRRIRGSLPATATFEALDRRFVLAHGHEHDDTSLSLLARQEDADVVIVGHSHAPVIDTLDDVVLVNPGSYADPRWHEPAFATVERSDGTVAIRLRRPDGDVIATETV